jgi:hypothetical protein
MGRTCSMHGDLRKTCKILENLTRRDYLGGQDVKETVMVILHKIVMRMAGLIWFRSRSRGGLL